MAGMVFPSPALADGDPPATGTETPTPIVGAVTPGSTETSGGVGTTPTAEDSSASVSSTPTPAPSEGTETSTPSVEEVTPGSAETSEGVGVAPTVESTPTPALVEGTETSTPSAEEELSAEAGDIPGVIDALDNAGAVLVDEQGNSIPLAAESAAAALLAPDPVGCPAGVQPVSWGGTGIGCTVSYTSIQDAINDVAVVAGWTIYIDPGVFSQNINVNKSVTLQGSGVGVTIVRPSAASVVDLGCGAGSCASPANTVLYITADNVAIRDLTVDGDNTSMVSGTTVNGVDVNARNGIYGNDANNLVVEDTEIKNVYLRGIQVAYSDSVSIRNNVVDNVDGSLYSISVFNFGGGGMIENNTITRTGDGIALNWSTGTQVLNNTVSEMGTGIHTDNTQGSDVISGNTIFDGSTDPSYVPYGVFVFAPYQPVSVTNNTITNVGVGLAVSGNGYNDPLNTIAFTNNAVTAYNTGAYVTTDVWGYFFSDVSAQFNNNALTGGDYGFYLEASGPGENIGSASGYVYDCAAPSCALNVTGSGNSITGQNLFAATVATGDTSWFSGGVPVWYGTYNVDLRGNWWGQASGPNDTDSVKLGCNNSNILTNPAGSGGVISECILYDAWIASNPAAPGGGEGGNANSAALCQTREIILPVSEIKVFLSGLCGYEVILENVVFDQENASLMGELSKMLYPELTSALDSAAMLKYGVSIRVLKDGVPVQTLPLGANIRIVFPTTDGIVSQWMTPWAEVESEIVEDELVVRVGSQPSFEDGKWIYIVTDK